MKFPIRFKQWEVVRQGLQSFDHYQIEKSRLAETIKDNEGRVCSDWLLHLAQKEWCEIDDFIIAWLTACRMHRVNIDHIDIAASVAKARWRSARGRAFKAELDRQHRGKFLLSISDLCAVDESAAMREWRQTNPRP